MGLSQKVSYHLPAPIFIPIHNTVASTDKEKDALTNSFGQALKGKCTRKFRTRVLKILSHSNIYSRTTCRVEPQSAWF